MICISLKNNVNCEYVCKVINDYIKKNIKSAEQAEKTILRISLVEIKDSENDIKKLN